MAPALVSGSSSNQFEAERGAYSSAPPKTLGKSRKTLDLEYIYSYFLRFKNSQRTLEDRRELVEPGVFWRMTKKKLKKLENPKMQ